MADRMNKWDIEGLGANLNLLKKERENLIASKTFLMNLGAEVMQNWQSFAGDIYLENVEIDVENLDYIVEALQNLGEDLDYVTRSIYQDCEDQVKAKLSKLSSSIGSI